jgi:hypothetical protein
MSARFTSLDFESGDQFELEPKFERQELETRFAGLKDELLGSLLEDTQTLDLHPRFKQAANEAAGVAWTTEYPLLVFPTLFEEFARRERARQSRQQQILAQTEHLMTV